MRGYGMVAAGEGLFGLGMAFALALGAMLFRDGALTIDRSTMPATYRALGATRWSTTRTTDCGEPPAVVEIGGAWVDASGALDDTGAHGLEEDSASRHAWSFAFATP